MQREIFIPYNLPALRWVDNETVKNWTSWREAVIWCWDNRELGEGDDIGDQVMFRRFAMQFYGKKMHAPHMSRWFNKHTKAPMDMPQDLAHAFEGFTGWRGLTQYFNRSVKATCLEELQARAA